MRPHRLIVLLACGACATPAQAAPLDRFYLPSTPGGDLRAVAPGPDGRVWVALRGAIGAVDRDGSVAAYPTGGLTPAAIAAGPDGDEWFVAGGTVARVAGGVTSVVARGLPAAQSITAGPDGAMWVAETSAAMVARVAVDGTVRQFPLGQGIHAWWIVGGPDGNLWFTGSRSGQGLVGRLTPAGAVQAFNFPLDLTQRAPTIAAGRDGNLWVATGFPDALLRVTPAGVRSTIDVGDVPRAVAAGPDGSVWFTTYDALVRRAPSGALTRFRDPYNLTTNCRDADVLGPEATLALAADGTAWTPYPDGAWDRAAAAPAAPSPVRPVLPARGSLKGAVSLLRMADGSVWIGTRRAIVHVGADGRRRAFHPRGLRFGVALAPAPDGGVWFSSYHVRLARMTPAGRVRDFSRRLPHGVRVGELAPGRRGSVWFVDFGRHAVGRLTAAGRELEIRLARRSDPFGIAARPDGGVWVTDSRHAIERISAAGRVHRFARPGTDDVPAIVTAPDGSAWFTDFGARRVGHIAPGGGITFHRTHGHPTAITLGSDGSVWFTTTASRTAWAGLGWIDASGVERELPVHMACTASYLGLTTGPDGDLWFTLDDGPVAVAALDPRRLAQTGAP